MTLGHWWTPVDGRFHCDLCPRACTLKPGQRGFCFVRQATDQGVELTTYTATLPAEVDGEGVATAFDLTNPPATE